MSHLTPDRRRGILWESLSGQCATRDYEPGATLFREGNLAESVFFVEDGSVSLTSSAQPAGLREEAGGGAVLGLSESMAGALYKATAEVLEPARVSVIDRESLLRYLRQNCEICMQLVQLLSEDLHALYHQFRLFDVSGSRSRRKPLQPVQ